MPALRPAPEQQTGNRQKDCQFADSCVVLFAKAPVPGTVKTRLQAELGTEGCVTLHRQLVTHSFHTLWNAHLARVEISVAGSMHPFFTELIDGLPIPVSCQKGDDLGERMFNAVVDRLKRFHAVIIVGSDCPFIDAAYLRKALLALEQGNDAVLGPAMDGGYVLIGMTRIEQSVFDGINWGTEGVLQATRSRFQALNWRWRELPVLADIDRPQDLKLLHNIELL